MLRRKRAAKNICYTLAIGKDIEGEHPFDEDIDWLRAPSLLLDAGTT